MISSKQNYFLENTAEKMLNNHKSQAKNDKQNNNNSM